MKLYFIILTITAYTIQTNCRSPLRTPDRLCPHITTRWVGDSRLYSLHDPYLEFHPLFNLYDEQHFNENLLPAGPITFRHHPEKSVTGEQLSALIEELLDEVRRGRKLYKNFIVLKNADLNRKKEAGLLVARCKKYPFVVKLFMETPRSFIRPYNKGFVPTTCFVIGGGATRHFLGFTRIKNLKTIKKRIENHPYWSKRVDVPRKWFWLPKKVQKMELTGYKIGGHEKISIEVPAIYAVVADEIDAARPLSIFSKEDRRMAIDLSNFLLCRVDPHINNFLIEKGTNKLIIVDTEHFPSWVGFKKRPKITRYSSWYLNLVAKYAKEKFCRTKYQRRMLQSNPTPPFSTP